MKCKCLLLALMLCISSTACDSTSDDSSPFNTPFEGTEHSEPLMLPNDGMASSSFDEADFAQEVNTQTQLSMVLYPEWIYLSENFWDSSEIYSPIDHDYNIRAMKQDFIGDAASEFIQVWSEELNFQYNQCIQIIPEDLRVVFEAQQSSWQEYLEHDAFNEIGAKYGYGYVRESFLTYMDKIRTRTLEIMRIQHLIKADIAVGFNYRPVEDE